MRAAGITLLASLAIPSPTWLPQRPAQQAPAFRSGVQLLEVDARVFDRDGRFVSDLTIDDFEIIEDGQRQNIQTMFLVRGPSASAATPSGVELSAPVLRVPQTWIFIFDHRHLMPGGYRRAKTALDAFMAERFRAGDLAGVVVNDKMVDNRITSVRSEFLAILRKVKIPGDAAGRAADAAEANATDADDEAGQNIAGMLKARAAAEVKRAARMTTELLGDLAEGLAAMPGPKTVVLLSDGFGLADLEGTLRSVVGQMNRGGARIYAIDTRGMAGPPPDAINSLAVDTGGLVLFNQNNIGPAFDAIAADTNTYYVLGYQPSNARYDGRYRKIDVRVTRPDVTVRARKGYLALQPSMMLVPKPVK